jgi:acyl-CoA thioesterase
LAELDPQALAEAVGAGMMAHDPASRELGMRIADIGPGRCTMTMMVLPQMLNGFSICHGGYITLLADSAFAFACNSYNELTVAAGVTVDFLAPAYLAEELTAAAVEVSRSGRTGLYDVTVTNPRGETVAVLRGRSHALKGRQTVPL